MKEIIFHAHKKKKQTNKQLSWPHLAQLTPKLRPTDYRLINLRNLRNLKIDRCLISKVYTHTHTHTHHTQGTSLVAQMVKNLPAMQEAWVLIPGSGRSPRKRHGNPLQYSCLEHSMDRAAWPATVQGFTKEQTHKQATHTHTHTHTHTPYLK